MNRGIAGQEKVVPSIPARFEQIVRQFPDRLAVKVGNRTKTYGELNQAANGVARAILARRRSGPEPIALLFEDSADAIAVILGILKAGKFFVVIDPRVPRERNAYIISDAGANLIVTDDRNAERARKLLSDDRSTLNLDLLNEDASEENLGRPLSPDDLVNIQYTSGSSGAPKGLVEAHRTVLRSVQMYTDDRQIVAQDRLTLLHSLSFASARLHLWNSLLNGAGLFPFDIKSSGVHRLAKWLEGERISVYHSPPSVFRQVAESLSGREKLDALRLVHLSGAPITQLDFDLYKEKFPHETLLEIAMGSTEAGVIGSAVLDRTFSFPKVGTPVGYPQPGKTILLLDENRKELERGQIGEIVVKGRHLKVGHWRRQQLDSATFLPDPSGSDERIYLTGDIGMMLPDGFLIHLGRKDFMVKIRGYRVEFGEVEKALLEHEQVKAAAIAAWDRERGEKHLAAYVVARQRRPTVSELNDFLRKKLPDYMIPSTFMFMESLPLTNGKLDRKALPKPDERRPELSQSYVAPRNEFERMLAKIWAAVLSLDRVGIHDSFFDLGGHSLAATRVVSQVIKHFRLELPLQSLFQSPTVAAMAAVIDERQRNRLSEAELERILTEVEAMSEEEARRLSGAHD